MLRLSLLFLFLTSLNDVLALPSTSGTCEFDKDYNQFGNSMEERRRNRNSGNYTLTANMLNYTTNFPIEITIEGPEFTGIIFIVVDDMGNNVGSFDTSVDLIQSCEDTVAVVTHTSNFEYMTSYTLFWLPPAINVGKVHVVGYILKGRRGDTKSSQEFYRFAKNENSSLSLNSVNVFDSGFE